MCGKRYTQQQILNLLKEIDAGDKMIAYGSDTIPYDAAGRPTQWPVDRPSTGYGLAYMNWDYEGRLTQIKASGGGTSVPFFTSTYNGLNTRVAANAAPAGILGYRRFSRSGAGVTAPLRSMPWGNLLSPSYTRSTPGVSKRTGSTTTYAHNGIKNEDAQSQTSTAISDAWGNVIGSSGTWQGISGYGGPYGYQEDETGIKLLGNRFYDPNAGRFLTRDPVQDGRNWHSYCDNTPQTGVDPEGLQKGKLIREFIKWLGRLFRGPGKVVKTLPKPKLTPFQPKPQILSGRQGKHQIGNNNYIQGRSILTYKNPQLLVDRFAGKGQPVGKIPRGQPGFKERIDFGEIIGIYRDPSTGTRVPTTKGIIVYAKDGVHIYPVRP